MATQAQLKWYRGEWAKVRKVLRSFGRSPLEADAERMEIHVQAGAVYPNGSPKSSLHLTNRELDRVMAIFWSWSIPDSLGHQMRQEHQPGIRLRGMAELYFDLYSDIDPEHYMTPDARRTYVEALFKKLNPKKSIQEPIWCGIGEWEKVFSALTYRYDQIVRKALGMARKTDPDRRAGSKKRVQFHPSLHPKHMQRIREHQLFLSQRSHREEELVAAGETIDTPF